MRANKNGDALFAIVTFSVILAVLLYLFMPRHHRQEEGVDTDGTPEPQQAVTAEAEDAWCIETPDERCMSGICGAAERTVVIFHAEWCGWCHQLREQTLTDPRVREALSGYGRILVEAERNAGLADRYRIDGFPTIIFFGPECDEVGRIPGYLDADGFLDGLSRMYR